MAKTVADALNDARALLQDTGADNNPVRYSQDDLVAYFNSALIELRRLRPDAFLALYDVVPGEVDIPAYNTGQDLTAEAFPVDLQFFTPVVFFITGMAELRDDEFTVDGRAVTVMQQFEAKLTGGDISRRMRAN